MLQQSLPLPTSTVEPADGSAGRPRRRIGALRRIALAATTVAALGGASLASTAGIASAASAPAPVAAAESVTGQMQNAANWAIAEKNSPDPTWSDNFNHAWSGWCEQFVEQAEGFAFRFDSAMQDYQWEADNGRIHGDTDPPVGALVFYGSDSPDGHVAVSIGGGQVVGTLGYPGDNKPVSQYPVAGYISNYLGWALPIGS